MIPTQVPEPFHRDVLDHTGEAKDRLSPTARRGDAVLGSRLMCRDGLTWGTDGNAYGVEAPCNLVTDKLPCLLVALLRKGSRGGEQSAG
jgi:hypothetical protein